MLSDVCLTSVCRGHRPPAVSNPQTGPTTIHCNKCRSASIEQNVRPIKSHAFDVNFTLSRSSLIISHYQNKMSADANVQWNASDFVKDCDSRTFGFIIILSNCWVFSPFSSSVLLWVLMFMCIFFSFFFIFFAYGLPEIKLMYVCMLLMSDLTLSKQKIDSVRLPP